MGKMGEQHFVAQRLPLYRGPVTVPRRAVGEEGAARGGVGAVRLAAVARDPARPGPSMTWLSGVCFCSPGSVTVLSCLLVCPPAEASRRPRRARAATEPVSTGEDSKAPGSPVTRLWSQSS